MRDNRTNTIPFPPLFHPVSGGTAGVSFFLLRILYYLPVPLYGLTAVYGLTRLLKGNGEGRVLLLFSALGFLAFNQTIWRSDLAHLFQSLPPFYLLILVLFERMGRRWSGVHRVLVFGIPIALLLILHQYTLVYRSPAGPARIAAEGFQPVPPYYTGSVVQLGEMTVPLPLERARVLVSPGQAAFMAALQRTIDEYSRPGDYILTVPGLQLSYFLFDRKNPTGYIHLRRSLDSREEEARYISDILDHDTRLVLLRDLAIDGRPERRFRVFAAAPTAAIESSFDMVDQIGDINVFVRRGSGI